MVISKSLFSKIYLSLLSLSIYSYTFGVMDRMAAHYLYIGILNTVAFLSIPFIFKDLSLKSLFNNYPVKIFGGFLFFSLLSMINSINIIESLVEINQIITFFFSLIIIVFLAKSKNIDINFLLLMIILTLIIDISISLFNYIDIVFIKGQKFGYDEIIYILGLFGNRNILAITIAMRIPFVILYSLRLNKANYYILLFSLITLSFFTIILLSSRTAYLSLVILLLLLIVYLFYRVVFLKKKFFLDHKPILFLFILPFFLSYYLSTQTISDSDRSNVTSRISSIADSSDESRNIRLRYFTQAIETIAEYPIFGIGIGNWKIYSIKKDSKNIKSYIVPYNVHNDILEFTAEIGIIGGMLFVIFFIHLGLYVLNKADFNSNDFYWDSYSILILMPFIIYITDLNLNFPSTRPENLYLLLMYIGLVYTPSLKSDDKK